MSRRNNMQGRTVYNTVVIDKIAYLIIYDYNFNRKIFEFQYALEDTYENSYVVNDYNKANFDISKSDVRKIRKQLEASQ